jgi:predicted molibdopterin-dependent oxidoreductase YjgC
MFKPLPDCGAREVRVTIDGREITVCADLSVAAAVLAYADGVTRTTPISNTPRAPYCLMGVCFDCLMEIDGVQNRQACLVPVREGMRIERQSGKRMVSP